MSFRNSVKNMFHKGPKCPNCRSINITSRQRGKATGSIIGGIFGLSKGGPAGAAGGYEVGGRLGSSLDGSVFSNRECLECGHTWSE